MLIENDEGYILGTITTYYAFYTNSSTLVVEKSTFTTLKGQIDTQYSYTKDYDNGQFIFLGIDIKDATYINQIDLSTNEGDFYVNTGISSTTLVQENNDFDLSDMKNIFISSILDEEQMINFKISNIAESIEIKNITLFNNGLPEETAINEIYMNGDEINFDSNTYLYSDKDIDINIKLNNYYLGNYSFKILYEKDGNINEVTTNPIRISLDVPRSLSSETVKQYVDSLLEDELLNELQKID
ncbi:hypothetical protein KHQ89_02385 [Mycoplasmatota bacterium]|nr:hypothetical protein KHQ89_02385 [Mycoplasmatota bacterium]